MNSRKKTRLVLSVISAGLLSIVSASSEAGRSVRSDASDGAFEFLGGFWGSDIEQFGDAGFAAGKTEFKLKLRPSGDPHFFNVCMGEGFVKLIATSKTCADSDFTRPPTGNYIAVFAADLDGSFGRLVRTRGFVDTSEPFKLGQAAPAMRFWWNGVVLAGDSTFTPFDVQINLIDRSNGTNNGNFDIEFNYGSGGGDVVPPVPNTDGFQGFVLGSNKSGPIFGPFGPFDTDGAPIRFCFRNGALRATC